MQQNILKIGSFIKLYLFDHAVVLLHVTLRSTLKNTLLDVSYYSIAVESIWLIFTTKTNRAMVERVYY